MSDKEEVREASRAFYAALNSTFNKDATPMRDIWLHSPEVTAMRPNGGREVGWDSLWEAWQHVADVFSGGKVELTEQVIVTDGNFAYEIGLEIGTFYPGGETVEVAHRATNIYRRSAEGWKVVHHHTDKSDGAMVAFSHLET
ncbi:MAG: nuclear transport factor 2 family protein [Roseibium sp.]|uniref:YybH family protein n=1 Tax=Roseibium sp. TaxID=1936156 RepID=UPI003D9C5012